MNTADVAFPHIGIYIPHLIKNISPFGFTIAIYGIIIAIGMIAGIVIARFVAKRTDQDPDFYSDFALWGILFALIGARIYYIVFYPGQFQGASFIDYIAIWNGGIALYIRGGGLAIYGGVIASVITAIVYCRIKKYNFLLFADTATCGLILGQIIGRWGNFTNQEAFGSYTDSLLAMRLKTSNVNPSYITDEMLDNAVKYGSDTFIQVHPTFLYESLWNLIVLIIMLVYTGHKKADGEVFLIYLTGYGLGRFFIEGLRIDQLKLFSTGIAVSQLLSLILVICGIIAWIFLRVKKAKDKGQK